jgi:hypothetical protein
MLDFDPVPEGVVVERVGLDGDGVARLADGHAAVRKMSRLATRSLYLTILRCSSR